MEKDFIKFLIYSAAIILILIVSALFGLGIGLMFFSEILIRVILFTTGVISLILGIYLIINLLRILILNVSKRAKIQLIKKS